jgi:PPOX class probable F420-dependent enzyme
MLAARMPGAVERLPTWAQDMLRHSRVARLGLVDERDRPRVLPVTFALADGVAWSAVDDKPKRGEGELARVRFLRRRAAAALTADRYDDDWSALAWVQLLGEVSLIEDRDRAGAGLDALRAKYSQYAEREPPGPFLRLEPERALCWRASEEA